MKTFKALRRVSHSISAQVILALIIIVFPLNSIKFHIISFLVYEILHLNTSFTNRVLSLVIIFAT